MGPEDTDSLKNLKSKISCQTPFNIRCQPVWPQPMRGLRGCTVEGAGMKVERPKIELTWSQLPVPSISQKLFLTYIHESTSFSPSQANIHMHTFGMLLCTRWPLQGVGSTRMHTLTTLEQETVRESKKCPLVDETASTRWRKQSNMKMFITSAASWVLLSTISSPYLGVKTIYSYGLQKGERKGGGVLSPF
jgi:hypothetical protein